MSKIQLVAMDLDGTLTQHKTPPEKAVIKALDALSERYKLLMAGAGQCMRIWKQLGRYPIDIIGNYGMQYAVYRRETGELEPISDISVPCDRAEIEKRAAALRERYGLTDFRGDPVEYHPSGCVTFPILGTAADPKDKLSYDPDRKKRRRIYREVAAAFPEYNVFVGGSSSFDMAPKPYDKLYALTSYCRENNIPRENVVYFGDDYGQGGNDECVYLSDFRFIRIDDYRRFPEAAEKLLKEDE